MPLPDSRKPLVLPGNNSPASRKHPVSRRPLSKSLRPTPSPQTTGPESESPRQSNKPAPQQSQRTSTNPPLSKSAGRPKPAAHPAPCARRFPESVGSRNKQSHHRAQPRLAAKQAPQTR